MEWLAAAAVAGAGAGALDVAGVGKPGAADLLAATAAGAGRATLAVAGAMTGRVVALVLRWGCGCD